MRFALDHRGSGGVWVWRRVPSQDSFRSDPNRPYKFFCETSRILRVTGCFMLHKKGNAGGIRFFS